MKVYEAGEKDLKAIGYPHEEERSIRLSGKDIQIVKEPARADVVVIHASLRSSRLNDRYLDEMIRHLGVTDERRVVAYDCSDEEEDYQLHPNCLFIRCSAKGWYVRRMPRTISWAWPVEDLGKCQPIPEVGFAYDVGFHGWLSSNVRNHSVDSVTHWERNNKDIKFDCATYKDFYGYIENTPEGRRRRGEFLRSLQECKLQLTPCSIHNVFPYRFFEAMSAGRVPVLFCTDYVLPFKDKIDWDGCTFRYDADKSPEAGNIVKTILNKYSTEQLVEMGAKGREAWLKWLNRDKFNDLFKIAIEERMRRDGLLSQK